MRVIVLVKATEDSENNSIPQYEMTKMLEQMDKFNDELVKAGIMEAGDCNGLTPSSQGKRVAFEGANRTVINGPFGDTSALVAGYWFWNVKNLDEAVEWVKRCPNPMPGYGEIEIRPIDG